MLFRKIEALIEEHLKSGSKKILLVDGARQVGKTYIISHVGRRLFENYIEINMVEDSIGERLFAIFAAPFAVVPSDKSIAWQRIAPLRSLY